MDKPSVYIETSIVSYLAARPSRDPLTLRNQQLTHAWWNTRRERYALWTSALTVAEASRGDPVMVQRRLAALAGIPLVGAPMAAMNLGRALRAGIPLPEQSKADAEHMALAAINGLTFLLTWDSKHIANPRLQPRAEAIFAIWGYTTPVFCTPGVLIKET